MQGSVWCLQIYCPGIGGHRRQQGVDAEVGLLKRNLPYGSAGYYRQAFIESCAFCRAIVLASKYMPLGIESVCLVIGMCG